MNEVITTVISQDKESFNIAFSYDGECIILLANIYKEPKLFTINKNQTVDNILYKDVKSEVIKEHIEFYLKVMDDLLKIDKDFEYINDFIKYEIVIS
jgi:serine kinase of HPr protein (carbohydrate metabolism regulator)